MEGQTASTRGISFIKCGASDLLDAECNANLDRTSGCMYKAGVGNGAMATSIHGGRLCLILYRAIQTNMCEYFTVMVTDGKSSLAR